MSPEAASSAGEWPLSRPPLRVAIVGAGLGGVAMAVNLAKRGIDNFTVFEGSAGPGGTWWDNRYPGAECDVASHLYSYSFQLQDWSRSHARQPEIQRYVESVIDGHGLRGRMRFGAAVTRAVWDEDTHTYTVTLQDGHAEQFDAVVSAVGLLNVPRYPSWPGLDTFAGPAFHTSRWEQRDLAGKRVAVVGAGSTAAQVVPALSKIVGTLLTFQREAVWVLPKGDHEFSRNELRRLKLPFAKRLARARILYRMDQLNRVASQPHRAAARRTQRACVDYMDKVFAGRPDLKELLTPKYPVRCKRIIISSDFLPSLLKDNVKVIPRSVTHVTPQGIVDADGVEHLVDAIVLATGFQPWNFLANLEVIGKGNRSLHGVWGEEPEAFLGLTVPDFPNFFMMYGPNTNGGVISFTLERQAEFIAKDLARLVKHSGTAIEVRKSFSVAFNRHLSRALRNVATWEANCHNYYHSSTGKNVTQWPWTHLRYWMWTKLLRVPSSSIRQADAAYCTAASTPAEHMAGSA
jgi:cation diffusion facilitator CzcD-associated flavoprotein CzcO